MTRPLTGHQRLRFERVKTPGLVMDSGTQGLELQTNPFSNARWEE